MNFVPVWAYLMIIISPFVLMVTCRVLNIRKDPLHYRVVFWAWWLFLFLMVGLRDQVGGDWYTYEERIELLKSKEIWAILEWDLLYELLNWIAAHNGLGVHFVNSVCSMIFAYGLLIFCRLLPAPSIGLAYAAPYFINVVAMGYTRQSVAVALVLITYVLYVSRRTLLVPLTALAAILSHKSAAAVVIFFFLSDAAARKREAILLLAGSLIALVIVIASSASYVIKSYYIAGYESGGGLVRSLEVSFFGLVVLYGWNTLDYPHHNNVMRICAGLASAWVVIFLMSSSNSAIDRFGLYFLGIQMFGICIVQKFSSVLMKKELFLWGVTIFSLTKFFIWLEFSPNSQFWLPYKNLIF